MRCCQSRIGIRIRYTAKWIEKLLRPLFICLTFPTSASISVYVCLAVSYVCLLLCVFFVSVAVVLLFCRLLSTTTRLSMTRNAVWCLSNLSRGKSPPPDFTKVSCWNLSLVGAESVVISEHLCGTSSWIFIRVALDMQHKTTLIIIIKLCMQTKGKERWKIKGARMRGSLLHNEGLTTMKLPFCTVEVQDRGTDCIK